MSVWTDSFGTAWADSWGALDAATAVADASLSSDGGISKQRQQQRWFVEVDGVPYIFHSIDELIAFLDSREVEEVKKAEVKAEKDAQRVVRIGHAKAKPVAPKVRIASPVEEIREYGRDLEAKIDRVYWRALASEISRATEEEEDIAFIATIV